MSIKQLKKRDKITNAQIIANAKHYKGLIHGQRLYSRANSNAIINKTPLQFGKGILSYYAVAEKSMAETNRSYSFWINDYYRKKIRDCTVAIYTLMSDKIHAHGLGLIDRNNKDYKAYPSANL